MKTEILRMTRTELAEWLVGIGEKPFRADQIQSWLMRGVPFHEMSNISLALREKLDSAATDSLPEIERQIAPRKTGLYAGRT